MSPSGILLRCLLIVTLCLESSLSLWASGAMAVERAAHAATADRPDASGDCEDDASPEQKGAPHEDCDCGAGSGCACACMLPVFASASTVPFSAQHLLADRPAVLRQTTAAPAVAARVFRPPIS
jgi:hypothetical protein